MKIYLCITSILIVLAPIQLRADTIHFHSKIHYKTDKFDIESKYQPVVDELAFIAKSYPEALFMISGHTDTVGSYNYNLNLSRLRAKGLLDAIVDRGVNKSRFKTYWYSYKVPAAKNTTKSGRAKNRRTLVTMFGLSKEEANTLAREYTDSDYFEKVTFAKEKLNNFLNSVHDKYKKNPVANEKQQKDKTSIEPLEAEPVAETEPINEPEPVAETEPINEAESVAETVPVNEAEPMVYEDSDEIVNREQPIEPEEDITIEEPVFEKTEKTEDKEELTNPIEDEDQLFVEDKEEESVKIQTDKPIELDSKKNMRVSNNHQYLLGLGANLHSLVSERDSFEATWRSNNSQALFLGYKYRYNSKLSLSSDFTYKQTKYKEERNPFFEWENEDISVWSGSLGFDYKYNSRWSFGIDLSYFEEVFLVTQGLNINLNNESLIGLNPRASFKLYSTSVFRSLLDLRLLYAAFGSGEFKSGIGMKLGVENQFSKLFKNYTLGLGTYYQYKQYNLNQSDQLESTVSVEFSIRNKLK